MNKVAIGIFGGTFDPFHNGHLGLIHKIIELSLLDAIYLMPNYIPPHKPQPKASDQDRLNMIKMVCEHEKNLLPLDYEIQKKSISYTYNTIRDLKNSIFDHHAISLIVGMDSLINFNSWYHATDLIQEINLIVALRPHYSLNNLDQILQDKIVSINNFKPTQSSQILIIENNPIDLSSSEIRDHHFNDLSQKIPPYLIDYIKQNNLYRP